VEDDDDGFGEPTQQSSRASAGILLTFLPCSDLVNHDLIRLAVKSPPLLTTLTLWDVTAEATSGPSPKPWTQTLIVAGVGSHWWWYMNLVQHCICFIAVPASHDFEECDSDTLSETESNADSDNTEADESLAREDSIRVLPSHTTLYDGDASGMAA
jgi:hypothetical protein